MKKSNKKTDFIFSHCSTIQLFIAILYFIIWRIIIAICFPSIVMNYKIEVDSAVIILELIYILVFFEKIFNDKTSKDKKLERRSLSAIQEYLKSAKHDVYISGIINNGVIHAFLNDPELTNICQNKGVVVHILFYISDDESQLDWYLKMLYGFRNPDPKIKSDKSNYSTFLDNIHEYDAFRKLSDNGLLKIKRISTPSSTAFVAKDIEADSYNGQIQCQFYQFMLDSPSCPTYTLSKNDNMFPEMRTVILNMWNSASEDLIPEYIKKLFPR